MAKVTDLLNTHTENQLTFSFEVTPELQEAELHKLQVEPTFFSITWHAKSHQNSDLDIPPIRLAKLLRRNNKNVLLHLSCDLLRKDFLSKLLQSLKEHSICNLFVILGENYDPDTSDFQSTEELIKEIRSETGDYFCIGVAGMPDCSDERLHLLKNKVDVGADYILTQAFFESIVYSIFSERCKNAGIDVPIIPGVFYFETLKQLNGFINLCKIKVSQDVLDYVKSKESADEIPGKEINRQLIKSLMVQNKTHHFHFFTLNKLDSVSSFIKQING